MYGNQIGFTCTQGEDLSKYLSLETVRFTAFVRGFEDIESEIEVTPELVNINQLEILEEGKVTGIQKAAGRTQLCELHRH